MLLPFTIDKLCTILCCSVEDIIEHIPDDSQYKNRVIYTPQEVIITRFFVISIPTL